MTSHRAACMATLLAAVALALTAPIGARAQTDLTPQQQLEAIDREIRSTEDTLAKYDAGGHFLVLAVYDSDGLGISTDMQTAEYYRRIMKGGLDAPVIAIAVTKQRMIDHIVMRLKKGLLSPKRAVQIASSLKTISAVVASDLREHVRGLKLLRERVAQPTKPKTPDVPKTTTQPGADRGQGGVWRLKEGYPKCKQKEQCAVLNQSNMRAELDAGSGSISLTVEDLHGSTKAVTHGFELQVSFGDLGKASYEPGEQSTFVLEGTYAWTKDGGNYTAAYPAFEYNGGVSVVSAEPRIGSRSDADSAQLRLGRATGGPFMSDTRTITFKAPASGKEFTLGIGIGPYGGALVQWVYEWVPK